MIIEEQTPLKSLSRRKPIEAKIIFSITSVKPTEWPLKQGHQRKSLPHGECD
jgi:hypothetical protein